MMKPRILVIAGLGLAVIIIALAVVLNLLPVQSDKKQVAGSTITPSSQQSEPKPAPATNAAEPAPANPKAPAATPDPKRPLEVIPPVGQPTNPTLPKSRVDAPLIKVPLPPEASANGKLVDGFPSTVILTEPASALKSSSVSPQGSILQVSLVARTPTEPLGVMAFYQKQFAALGLSAAQAPASTGATAMWFTRGTDKITVTATPHPSGGTEYSVFGIFHAEK